MGICGTAMGNAALLMRALGHEVMGSDTGIYPPMSEPMTSWPSARISKAAFPIAVPQMPMK